MSGNIAGFDADKAPKRSFEAIPSDSYKAAMTECPLIDIKSGAGKYLNCGFQILEGKYQNRMVWEKLCIIYPSKPDVEGRAKSDLASLCFAVGNKQPKDSSELCHKPLVIVVGQKKRSDTGEMQNVIRGYKPIDAFEPKPVDEQKAPWG